MSLQEEKSQRELLREQLQLIAPNLKSIIVKKPQSINFHEKQLLINVLKKIIFIKSSFDLNSPLFPKLAVSLILEAHKKNDIVVQKGDEGEYFYIVLEGVYCVEVQNMRQHKKEKQIYYYPGDSFGEVSLIYDVPRGATIVADQNSTLIKIDKATFNECGNLRQTIQHLNKFFENHSYFQKQSPFRIRIMSSLSKLIKFKQNDVLVEQGMHFNQILFFSKGEAKVYKTLQLQCNGILFQQTIQFDQLVSGDVFGQYYYVSKELSNIRIIATNRGQYIKVSFKQDIRSVDSPLSKRIRQNAARFPCDEQILDQYKLYCLQKLKQTEFLRNLYKNDKQKNEQLIQTKKRYLRVKNAKLMYHKTII